MAQIQQYIYTRLPKERSPRGKHGFQSAFLPAGWNDRGFILELESRIHFPEHDTFSEKHVVFYRKLGDKPHLILLWMRLLPELRDEQGRGGIFMVHGFIVPPEVHQKVRRPMTLMQILESKLFLDIEDVMSSPQVNLKTALINPVEVSDAEVKKLADTEATTEFPTDANQELGDIERWERELLSFLFKQISGDLKDWALAVKGEPGLVQQTFNRLAGYLPNDVREQLGWDPAFDGGKVFFSPFNFFGYSKAEPVTGQTMFFNLQGRLFLDSSLSHRLLSQDHPFDRFLEEVLKPGTPQEEIELAYKISMSLYQGHGIPKGLALEGDFALAIQGLVRGYFEQLLGNQVPRDWAAVMRDALDYATIRQTLNGQMADSLVTIGLDRTIIAQSLTPERMGSPLPPALVALGPQRLQLLDSMWTQKPVSVNQVKGIPPNSLQEAFRLMGTTKLAKKDWFFRLLAEYPVIFHNMFNDNAFNEKAEKWLRKQVPGTYRSVRTLLVSFMMQTGSLGEMKNEKPDWSRLMEQFLASGNYDRKDLKAIVGAASSAGFTGKDYPLLEAFSYPEEEIPSVIGLHKGRRERFAQAMVVCHNLGKKALRSMGFSDPEIVMALRNRRGIINKVKSLLGI